MKRSDISVLSRGCWSFLAAEEHTCYLSTARWRVLMRPMCCRLADNRHVVSWLWLDLMLRTQPLHYISATWEYLATVEVIIERLKLISVLQSKYKALLFLSRVLGFEFMLKSGRKWIIDLENTMCLKKCCSYTYCVLGQCLYSWIFSVHK